MLFLGKTNRDFKHNKLWGFIIILGLLLAFLYGIWLYNDDNRYVTWDDDTVGWNKRANC